MTQFPYGHVIAPNQRIGIFGGSFNPPHLGHEAIAEAALKRLQLDWLWWLVSPQNPLKSVDDTADFNVRLAQCRELVSHPRIVISGLEATLNSHNTAEMLRCLQPVLAQAQFVWVMGADSFSGLHHWHNWRDIPAQLPLAVFDRPGHSLKALVSPAAQILTQTRLDSIDAPLLPGLGAGYWSFISLPQRYESSSIIRATNDDYL